MNGNFLEPKHAKINNNYMPNKTTNESANQLTPEQQERYHQAIAAIKESLLIAFKACPLTDFDIIKNAFKSAANLEEKLASSSISQLKEEFEAILIAFDLPMVNWKIAPNDEAPLIKGYSAVRTLKDLLGISAEEQADTLESSLKAEAEFAAEYPEQYESIMMADNRVVKDFVTTPENAAKAMLELSIQEEKELVQKDPDEYKELVDLDNQTIH